MLNLKEVIAERKKAESSSMKAALNGIGDQLPSFRIIQKRHVPREPSYFKRLFSAKNVGKVISDASDDVEQIDPQFLNKPNDIPNKETEGDNDLTEQEDQDVYIDPPMPEMGKHLDIELLINRNQRAHYGLYKLMEMVTIEVEASIKESLNIPVDESLDRVTVTEEHSSRIASIRTNKDIQKHVSLNIQHIQKALNFRKSGLIMMNSNYSQQLVRKIEPIYANEARTVTQTIGDEDDHVP